MEEEKSCSAESPSAVAGNCLAQKVPVAQEPSVSLYSKVAVVASTFSME